MIGCGALGGDVAAMLAKAGVGELTLIDHDVLGWDNIGRHLLGAAEVAVYKAELLARHLQRQFPHLTIQAVTKKWQKMAEHQIESILRSDVIVSVTGDWWSDSCLNTRIRSGCYPPVVFGWTEPHGLAGHALLVGTRGGCLTCGRNEFGEVIHRVTEWTESTLKPLPACGGFFEPHGAIETGPIKAMIASLALDALTMSPPFARNFAHGSATLAG